MVPCMLRGEPNWKELKASGAGWWVKSSDSLKRLTEKVLLFFPTFVSYRYNLFLGTLSVMKARWSITWAGNYPLS